MARHEGVTRDTMYRRLNDLVAAGFASTTLTRPVTYVPTNPRDVLKSLLHQSEEFVQRIQRERRDVEGLLVGLQGAGDGDSGMPFRILSGRRRAYDVLHEMLDQAVEHARVVHLHPSAADLATEAVLWKHAQERAEDGLDVQILLADSPSARRLAPRFGGGGHCQIRLLQPQESIGFAVADRHRMLFLASGDQSPWMDASDCFVVTERQGFIEAQIDLFERLWHEAATVRHARAETA